MTPSKITRKYRQRAVAILENIEKLPQANGYAVSAPWDFENDRTPTWVLSIDPDPDKNRPESVDIFLEFMFSEAFDGEKGGVNFGVRITSEEGSMLGGLCPFNYPKSIWVPRKNPEAVEERFKLLESADSAVVLLCLQTWEKHLESLPRAPQSPSQGEATVH